MADTDKLVFSPLVGFDNIVQTKDDNGEFKPHVRLTSPAPAGFVPLNSFGESEEYKIVAGGTGRKGTMKTSLFFVVTDDFNDGVNLALDVYVQIPSGLRGLADPNVKDPDGKNPAGIIDPTLFSPSVSFGPAWNALLSDGDIDQYPDGADTIAFLAGVDDDGYVAAVYAAEAVAAGDIANAGANGYMKIKAVIDVPASSSMEEPLAFALIIDFSHSIGN